MKTEKQALAQLLKLQATKSALEKELERVGSNPGSTPEELQDEEMLAGKIFICIGGITALQWILKIELKQ